MLTIIKAMDSDGEAIKVFARNFPHADAIKCRAHEFADKVDKGEADVVLACPPPDLRIADIENVIRKVRPRQFLIEMPSDTSPASMRLFSSQLDDYFMEWRAINDADFGVPSRELRMWVWGMREDLYGVFGRAWAQRTRVPPSTDGILPPWADVQNVNGDPSEWLALRTAPWDFSFPESTSREYRINLLAHATPSATVNAMCQAMQRADAGSKSAIMLFCGAGLFACGAEERFKVE